MEHFQDCWHWKRPKGYHFHSVLTSTLMQCHNLVIEFLQIHQNWSSWRGFVILQIPTTNSATFSYGRTKRTKRRIWLLFYTQKPRYLAYSNASQSFTYVYICIYMYLYVSISIYIYSISGAILWWSCIQKLEKRKTKDTYGLIKLRSSYHI
jgi:hypothetical protein